MRWQCKIGVHKFSRRRVEFGIYNPSEASIIEVCDCGKYRIVGSEIPTKIVSYDVSSYPYLKTKWVRVFDDNKVANLKIVDQHQ